MDDFQAIDAVILCVLVLAAVAASFPTGLRKGEEGASFRTALVAGFGRTVLLVMAVATLVGAGIARYEIGRLGASDDYGLWEVKGSGPFARLRDVEGYWDQVPCGCLICRGEFREGDRIRAIWISESLATGYALPFIAPAFGLLALLPSVMATTMGFNLGSRRRVVALMGQVD